jgi:hypothetical protein
MEFTLLENIEKSQKENTAKRIYTKDKAVFYETSKETYALQYTKTETGLQNIIYTPHRDAYFVKEMEGTNNSKWNLYSNRISYHQHESTTSISVIVTDEAATIDSKGVLWCVIEDRLSSVTYVQGKLSVVTIDFEALDFLTLKNNTVKSI